MEGFVYVRDCYETVAIREHFVSNENIEMMHIVIKGSNQKNVDLFAIYRPPSGNVQKAIDSVQALIENCTRKGETLVLGDFNLDVSRQDGPKTRSLLTMTNSFALTSHINTPTRITNRSPTVIDLMFSNITHVFETGTINVNISDHLPTYLVKKKRRTSHVVSEIRGRSYRNIDWDAFREEVRQIDLTQLFHQGNPNKVWDTFYSEVLAILNRYCPVKTIRLHRQDSPFITAELAEQIHIRDKLFRTARRTGIAADWTEAKRKRAQV